MTMTEWAENEIRLACERERKLSGNKEEWDYGCACYESALKAYKSLMEDGHSGYSIVITKGVLIRLIEGRPLTPIEDTEDVWDGRLCKQDDYTSYQCKRMSSLFKGVFDDGTVKYHDVDRVHCVYVDNPDISWSNGFISRIIDEMFPIEMPYYANEKFTVYCEEFLTDKKNGDFDTLGVIYAVKKPDGERIEINRYFKEDGARWAEIDIAEYEKRKEMRI